jgi:2-polyprenyl-3-methyl-5-hydroxy-6-metoxy-1,4-benzoquinol methylase
MMVRTLNYEIINGIKCYSIEMADDYSDYPDSGFDVTEENATKSFWVSSRLRLFTSLLKTALKKSGGKRFFEIGCGTGDLVRNIANDGRFDVTGSEIYIKGLTYAKAKVPGVEFVQFDASQGIIDGSYNVIAAFDVLEHIEEDEKTMENIYSMLAPNGRFVLSVPQYMFLWSNLDDIVKHKRRYSRNEMLMKLKKCGFEVEKATSFVFVLFPLMILSRILDRSSGAPLQDDCALEKRTRFSSLSNTVFDAVMRIDEGLIGLGASLPWGGTLVVVARRPSEGPRPPLGIRK